jgi:hypothetical protein
MWLSFYSSLSVVISRYQLLSVVISCYQLLSVSLLGLDCILMAFCVGCRYVDQWAVRALLRGPLGGLCQLLKTVSSLKKLMYIETLSSLGHRSRVVVLLEFFLWQI